MPAASARSAIALPIACGRGLVAAVLDVAARGPCRPCWPTASVWPVVVVDHLGVNVLVAAEHAQPRTLGRAADALADAKRAPLTLSVEMALL